MAFYINDLLTEKTRDLLPTGLYQYLSTACISYDRQAWLETAVWGAVFTEAFLDLLADDAGLKPGAPGDFRGRIEQLRNVSRNSGSSPYILPDDILKRAEELRNVRNRLVHETGLPKDTIKLDAEGTLSHLKQILTWYQSVALKKRGRIEPKPSSAQSTALVPFFFGTITPHTVEQAEFLSAFKRRLRVEGLDPREVVPTPYDRKDPLGKVKREMDACHAVILVGLERTHSYLCADRRGSDKEQEYIHRKYTSGWLHIEGGMAFALGKMVFPLCEQAIAADGIFDREWNAYEVTVLPELNIDHEKVSEYISYIRDWLSEHPWAVKT